MSDSEEEEKVSKLRRCCVCHCKLYLKDFYRYNSKNKVKRYYKVCNWCIVKCRNKQNKIKNIDEEKQKIDVLVKKMSHAVYIDDE